MKKILKFLFKKLILAVLFPIWFPIAIIWDDFLFWMHDEGWFD
jgi:hypothetical protein